MTKQEAVHAMVRGEKVTHRYFSPDEWATMKDGYILFEDGVKCSVIEFWNNRTDKQWEFDWSIWGQSKCDHCAGSGYDPYPNHDTTIHPCPKCSGV